MTLAEACFGLGVGADGKPVEARYEQARYWMREALVTTRADWEYETTVRQLVSIARLQQGGVLKQDSPAMRTLQVLLADYTALESVQIGKVGLDSPVAAFVPRCFTSVCWPNWLNWTCCGMWKCSRCSGGSIIGAHYYLKVRRLLQTKSDGESPRRTI